ncbi:MAG: hypothetical protein AB7W59_01910 [Acidimicrobiia bacterium]
MTKRDAGWSRTDGGYGLSLASDGPTPEQEAAARRALARAAVRAGDDGTGLHQALAILGLLPDQTGDAAT